MLFGDRPALDFVNTVDPRDDEEGFDYLEDYDAFLEWVSYAKVLPQADIAAARRDAKASPRRARAAWAKAIEARELLYEILAATATGDELTPKSASRFAELVAEARSQIRLRHEDGSWIWSLSAIGPLDRARIALVDDAVDLLESGAHFRLCEGDRCGWLFLDTTKNHSRRWCSMAGCGNRAKSQRFQERARAARNRLTV